MILHNKHSCKLYQLANKLVSMIECIRSSWLPGRFLDYLCIYCTCMHKSQGIHPRSTTWAYWDCHIVRVHTKLWIKWYSFRNILNIGWTYPKFSIVWFYNNDIIAGPSINKYIIWQTTINYISEVSLDGQLQ